MRTASAAAWRLASARQLRLPSARQRIGISATKVYSLARSWTLAARQQARNFSLPPVCCIGIQRNCGMVGMTACLDQQHCEVHRDQAQAPVGPLLLAGAPDVLAKHHQSGAHGDEAQACATFEMSLSSAKVRWECSRVHMLLQC